MTEIIQSESFPYSSFLREEQSINLLLESIEDSYRVYINIEYHKNRSSQRRIDTSSSACATLSNTALLYICILFH